MQHPTDDGLIDWVVDEENAEPDVAAHIADCAQCRKQVEEMRQMARAAGAMAAFQQEFKEMLPDSTVHRIQTATRDAYTKSKWSKVPSAASGTLHTPRRLGRSTFIAFAGGAIATAFLMAILRPFEPRFIRRGGENVVPWMVNLTLVIGTESTTEPILRGPAAATRFALLTSNTSATCFLFRVDSSGTVQQLRSESRIECRAMQPVVVPLTPPVDGVTQQWYLAAFTEFPSDSVDARQFPDKVDALIRSHLQEVIKQFDADQIEAFAKTLNDKLNSEPNKRGTLVVKAWVIDE